MKRKVSLTAGRKLKWLVPLAAVVLLSGVAGAADRLLIPEDLNLPFYSRGLGEVEPGLIAAIFYRPPECVPKKFNLEDFFDFNIDPDCPLLVEGFAIMEAGAAGPTYETLWNAPGTLVPVFFFSTEDVVAAEADGVLTIKEILRFKSLKVGWADSYSEILQPQDPSSPSASWHNTTSASGFLEDGRTFDLQFTDSNGNKNAKVTFGD